MTRTYRNKFLLTITLVSLTLFVSPLVDAGSAPGVLSCKSIGPTRPSVSLSGEIPGDYEVINLKILRGKEERFLKSLSTIDRDTDPEERKKLEEDGVIANDRVITLVEDFKSGVFAMAIRGIDGYNLRLFAMPRTIRTRITANSKKASFDALMIEGNDYPNWKKAVRMRCTFDHSI